MPFPIPNRWGGGGNLEKTSAANRRMSSCVQTRKYFHTCGQCCSWGQVFMAKDQVLVNATIACFGL